MNKQTPPGIVVRSLGNGRYSWRLLGNGPANVAAWGFTEDEALAHALAEAAYKYYLT